MRRTNPLFEADGTTASTTREGDDEATRRLRAGGTLAAAREFKTDGSARGSGGRCVFAKVDANGASVRWGEVRGAADEARLTRMCAFKNVSRVERRGDGLVVRLIKRDGDVVELTGQTVAQAAMWERGLAIVVREYAESAGANQALEAVDDDDAESNLDDTDDDDDVGGARLERGRANSASQARAFVPEPSTPTRAGAVAVGANDGHVMISVSPEASPSSRRAARREDLGVPNFGEDESLTNKTASNARRPLLQTQGGVDELATQFRNQARLTRCDISDIGSERSSDRSDFSDDDGGSSWGGSSAGGDALVIEAFSRARHGRVKELQKLFASGVDPRVRDGNGLTLLHIACQNNQRRSAKLVLKSTDYKSKPPRLELIDAQTNNGHTGLHFCFAYGYQALGEYLLSLGASDTITNVHGLCCYEGLEPNDARETLTTPEMKARAHESRMQRWIESQRPGANHDGYPRGVPSSSRSVASADAFTRADSFGGHDVPRQRSEPGGYVARSRSNSEYSDDRSHASYDSSGYPRGPPSAHGHPPPMQPYGVPQPYMAMPYAYAAPMMPMHPMYMAAQYPGMPPPPGYHHPGGYDDRYDDRDRRRRDRSRDRSPRRRRSRDRSRDRSRRSRDRSSRGGSRRSLGDRSDSLESGEERVGIHRTSSRRSSKATTPKRRPAKVDVIEATRGLDGEAFTARASAGYYSSDG
mmetsp:Transcript_6499/g.26081  ORF Transcript_6499/g.26081 Transcript_6499/m.26081 type:complete len:700 (-) Transcript_6499:1196-3295(-)